jgi:hypothetical protein
VPWKVVFVCRSEDESRVTYPKTILISLLSRHFTLYGHLIKMEIMSLANMAMSQFGVHTPYLSSGIGSENWYSPLVEWAIRIVVFSLFASAFNRRGKHGLWENVRIGK